jgi:hypothetical protein
LSIAEKITLTIIGGIMWKNLLTASIALFLIVCNNSNSDVFHSKAGKYSLALPNGVKSWKYTSMQNGKQDNFSQRNGSIFYAIVVTWGEGGGSLEDDFNIYKSLISRQKNGNVQDWQEEYITIDNSKAIKYSYTLMAPVGAFQMVSAVAIANGRVYNLSLSTNSSMVETNSLFASICSKMAF